MDFSRAWIILLLAWAATALLLAPMMADSLTEDTSANIAFFWCLLVSGVLIPLAHQFVAASRPHRRKVLAIAVVAAALFAFLLFDGRYTDDIAWIPIIWGCVFVISDWLLLRARSIRILASSRSRTPEVKERLRVNAKQNMAQAVEGFDANVADFKEIFLQEMPPGDPSISIGRISTTSMTDFMATSGAMKAAFAAFYIVFERAYDDPRDSPAYSKLSQHALDAKSSVNLGAMTDRAPYLDRSDLQKIYDLVMDPKDSTKDDKLRLAIVLARLFAEVRLKPPLAEEKDREALGQLMNRTLHRMRLCLQR